MAQLCLQRLSAPPPPGPTHLLFRRLRTLIAFSLTVLRMPPREAWLPDCWPLRSPSQEALAPCLAGAIAAPQDAGRGSHPHRATGRELGAERQGGRSFLSVLAHVAAWPQPWGTQEMGPPPVQESHPITQRSSFSEESIACTETWERNS